MSGDRRLDQEVVIRNRLLVTLTTGSRKLDQQRLRLFEVGGTEAFGEPAVDRREKIAGLGVAALVAAEPGKACCGAQLHTLCTLSLRHIQGQQKALFCLRLPSLEDQEITFETMQLGCVEICDANDALRLL